MSSAYLLTWLMIVLRTTGVVVQLPVFAGRPIPVMMRLGLAVGLATILAGVVPQAVLPETGWELFVLAGGEVLLGLALGFMTRMVFAAVEMAGRLIASEIGLTAAPGMGVPEPANEPLAALLSSLAVLLFFISGAHLFLLDALARSFHLVHAGAPAIDGAAGEALIRATGHVIELGLRIAAPFVAMNFLVMLAFSALTRAVPKINVFILSYSARVFAGIALLSGAGALIARYLYVEFGDMPATMLQILPVR